MRTINDWAELWAVLWWVLSWFLQWVNWQFVILILGFWFVGANISHVGGWLLTGLGGVAGRLQSLNDRLDEIEATLTTTLTSVDTTLTSIDRTLDSIDTNTT